MKKTAIALSLILALVLAMASTCLAAGLQITDISPADGETKKQPANMAIKITFDQAVDSEEALAANADKIVIQAVAAEDAEESEDAEEAADPAFQLACDDEKPCELWVLISDTLESKTTYAVTIKEGLVANSGDKTTEEKVISFTTRDDSKDGTVTFVIMIAMLVVMVVSTVITTKRQLEEKYNIDKGGTNPYKLAKEKGISLAEAQKICAKNEKREKEKAAKAKAKEEAMAKKREKLSEAEIAKINAELDREDRMNGIYAVKAKASLKAKGKKVPASVVKANKKRKQNGKRK